MGKGWGLFPVSLFKESGEGVFQIAGSWMYRQKRRLVHCEEPFVLKKHFKGSVYLRLVRRFFVDYNRLPCLKHFIWLNWFSLT